MSDDDSNVTKLPGGVIELTANANARSGLFMNAITGGEIPFHDGYTYTLMGYWRQAENSQNEVIDINLQLVTNEIEYYAEIMWILNPHSPNHGKVLTRVQGIKDKILFHVPSDHEWHFFSITVSYDLPNVLVRSVQFDSQVTEVNHYAGVIPKTGFPDRLTLLMETTNSYTKCDPDITTVGRSQWRDISAYAYPND